MTDEEYIEICAEMARKEARKVLENHLEPFERVLSSFIPNNATNKEFKELVRLMSKSRSKTTDWAPSPDDVV